MYHQPKVSVVIPAYNSDKSLEKSVNSVLNQSLKEIEIILVDDGSTDRTPTLFQHYKLEDNRVEVVTHPKNKGLGAARNSGIQKASGKYILFLDSDDYVESDALEFLYKKASNENLDILQGQYVEHRKKYRKIVPPYLPVFSKPISGLAYFRQKNFIRLMACVKLWKTDFLKQNKLEFPVGFFEDMYFTIKAYTLAQRINNIEFAFYHYMVHEQSISHQKPTQKHIDNYQNVLDNFQEFLRDKHLSHSRSNFPIAYAQYMVEFVKMGLKNKDPDVIAQVKNYVEQTNKKYRNIIIKNSHMSLPKRLLMYYSPFVYAKAKVLFNTILKRK